MNRVVEHAFEAEAAPKAAPAEGGTEAVYAAHADLVWATLQRFGVHGADLEDAFQDVFTVVQQKLPVFDGRARLSSWLFAICRRVASGHRRKARKARERNEPIEPEDVADTAEGPEQRLERRRAEARLSRALDAMDLDRRAVFVMFEIEEMGCDAIAELAGVPIGTVYSRLHAARKELAKLLEREARRAPARGEP